MDDPVPVGLKPPRIAGEITVARYLESHSISERWLVSVADRIHFLTDQTTAMKIRALSAASNSDSTYDEVHLIYHREIGSAAEPLSNFVRWCETHRQRLEQLAETPDNHVLSLRCPLFSGPTCKRIAMRLTWLFVPSTMLVLCSISLVVILGSLPFLVPPTGATALRAAAIALFGVLVHEFGHITACVRHRVKQGGIGVGLYWIWPVFYADVRGSWVLTARERLLVSAGGLYFQSIYLMILATIATVTRSPTVTLSVYITMLLMGNTLNPILKYDGYWILSDWLNVTNLHTQIASHLKSLCQPSNRDWKARSRPRLTLVLLLFTLFAFAFVWIVFRSLIAAGTSIGTELPNAVAALYHLFTTNSSTHSALMSGAMKVGYLLMQLAFVAMGMMMFGVRSVRAIISFASKAMRKRDVACQ